MGESILQGVASRLRREYRKVHDVVDEVDREVGRSGAL